MMQHDQINERAMTGCIVIIFDHTKTWVNIRGGPDLYIVWPCKKGKLSI